MTPLSIGRVALTVRDLDRVSHFYQQAVGFRLLSAGATSVQLGTETKVLLELRHDAAARPRSPRDAGLYHVAFLLPSRADLARFYRHAITTRLSIRTSDHLVSESVYFIDPEGNGIEFYSDRDRSRWGWTGDTVAMSVDWLDTEDLLKGAGSEPWQTLPNGTVTGHLNLQVGSLPEADAFYAGLLGFTITCRLPGASFFASGGYHHHIATNIWNSSGAPTRPEPVTGLAEIGIVAAGGDILDGIRSGLPQAELFQDTPDRLFTRDPWGTPVTVTVR